MPLGHLYKTLNTTAVEAKVLVTVNVMTLSADASDKKFMVWLKRKGKSRGTALIRAKGCEVCWNEKITQTCTLYRSNSSNFLKTKHFEVVVIWNSCYEEAPGQTFGSVKLNLAESAGVTNYSLSNCDDPFARISIGVETEVSDGKGKGSSSSNSNSNTKKKKKKKGPVGGFGDALMHQKHNKNNESNSNNNSNNNNNNNNNNNKNNNNSNMNTDTYTPSNDGSDDSDNNKHISSRNKRLDDSPVYTGRTNNVLQNLKSNSSNYVEGKCDEDDDEEYRDRDNKNNKNKSYNDDDNKNSKYSSNNHRFNDNNDSYESYSSPDRRNQNNRGDDYNYNYDNNNASEDVSASRKISDPPPTSTNAWM